MKSNPVYGVHNHEALNEDTRYTNSFSSIKISPCNVGSVWLEECTKKCIKPFYALVNVLVVFVIMLP